MAAANYNTAQGGGDSTLTTPLAPYTPTPTGAGSHAGGLEGTEWAGRAVMGREIASRRAAWRINGFRSVS